VPFVTTAHRITLALTTLALALTAVLTGAVIASPASATTTEDSLTARLNGARSDQGLPSLTPRSDLVAVARAQATRMADSGTLYHNPNLTTDVTNWRWVGENVGYAPDVQTVHVAFMNSDAHRANILDTDFTEVGVGVVERGDRVWVAEVFRRPQTITTSSSRTSTAGASPTLATVHHTLRYGSTGAAVRRVQGRLHLRQNGIYGTSTKAAVSRFQKRLGWAGRGNVGPGTWARLF
jgi:peptidoglycan hydrolase-like protein with peptidoglycan-binding domain